MALPDTSVKFFDSTMANAPELSGTAGALIGVLDACLIDGLGSVTLDSLVVSGNIATGTVSGGHGFAMIGETGPVIAVSDAISSELNGEWRLASVPSSTTFTFVTEGISDQTTTGTTAAKRAPAGWSKQFSGANKAVYARLNPQATDMVLRVDDAPTQYPTLTMYETMSDVDTGLGATSILYTGKSVTSSTTVRAWRIFADGQFFFLFVDGPGWGVTFFGDINSYRAGDAYNCSLRADPSASSSQFVSNNPQICNETYTRLARSYTQVGGEIGIRIYSHMLGANGTFISSGASAQIYPSPVDNSLQFSPCEVWEYPLIARGMLPGLYSTIHSLSVISALDGSVISPVPALGGGALFIQRIGNGSYGGVAIDISGPWR